MPPLAHLFRRAATTELPAPRAGSYRLHGMNQCSGCGGRHWIVGRRLAECADCATAVPLAETGLLGAGHIRRRGRLRRPLAL
ncbi:MAG: hypothetical protein ACXWUN_10370 [Allosphingosinicella sp.]